MLKIIDQNFSVMMPEITRTEHFQMTHWKFQYPCIKASFTSFKVAFHTIWISIQSITIVIHIIYLCKESWKVSTKHTTNQAIWTRNHMLKYTMKNSISGRADTWQSLGSPAEPCFLQETPAGWQLASFQGQWFPLGHQRMERVWATYSSVIHAVTMQTHIVSKMCEWMRPAWYFPMSCSSVSFKTTHCHSPFCRLLVT